LLLWTARFALAENPTPKMQRAEPWTLSLLVLALHAHVALAGNFTISPFPALTGGQTSLVLTVSISELPIADVSLTLYARGLVFDPPVFAWGAQSPSRSYTFTVAADRGVATGIRSLLVGSLCC
jgi:hypothetical protein